MSRPTRALIHRSALRGNLAVARRCNPGARMLAVVKANAYGHGLMRVADALAEADGFAVLDLDAAVQLRGAGHNTRILLLEGFFEAAELLHFAEHRLTAVVHSPEQIEVLERLSLPRPIDVMLKLNSGMNRLGFSEASFAGALLRLRACSNVGQIVLMTHFACADDARGVDWQLQVFRRAVAKANLPISLANSATILRYPELAIDWARPGIMLYGASPFPDRSAEELGLRPAMTLSSRIIATQTLEAGARIGYGATFVATARMRIGVVACGYADGYPRHAPSGTPVLVAGQRTELAGRVSMDMICVDLSHLPQAGVGSEVVLWGEGLPVEEVAASAGTVSYELLCALAPRVPMIEVG
jgi:alanine racemase